MIYTADPSNPISIAQAAVVNAAEGVRQTALAAVLGAEGALQGNAVVTDLTVATRNADIAFYRAVLASASAKGLDPIPAMTALRQLGAS